MLHDLFHHYMKHPEEVGQQSRKRARKVGRPRAVCDYLAGMTDRYVTLSTSACSISRLPHVGPFRKDSFGRTGRGKGIFGGTAGAGSEGARGGFAVS